MTEPSELRPRDEDPPATVAEARPETSGLTLVLWVFSSVLIGLSAGWPILDSMVAIQFARGKMIESADEWPAAVIMLGTWIVPLIFLVVQDYLLRDHLRLRRWVRRVLSLAMVGVVMAAVAWDLWRSSTGQSVLFNLYLLITNA